MDFTLIDKVNILFLIHIIKIPGCTSLEVAMCCQNSRLQVALEWPP